MRHVLPGSEDRLRPADRLQRVLGTNRERPRVSGRKRGAAVTVSEIMTSKVKSCGADTDLAAVAKTMWDCDCGVVPVIDETQRVIGMITDRDICIAAATRSEAPSHLRAREVMTRGAVHACAPE